MRRILIWTGLAISLCGVILWFYAVPFLDDSPHPETKAVIEKNLLTKPETQDPKSNHTPGQKKQKPLNLDLDSIEPIGPSTESQEGPIKPSIETPLTESAQDTLHQLDDTKHKQDKLLYGYEGKDEDDRHNLKLGIQKDDVKIKSGIKKGDDDTEIHNIEIEIKLPK